MYFSKSTFSYVRDESKVIYLSKDGKEERTKIYEVDPLTCPKCQNQMKIISVIENEEVIKKILKHLGLWDIKARPPKKEKSPGIIETPMDFSVSRLPPSEEHLFFDVEYPVEDPFSK